MTTVFPLMFRSDRLSALVVGGGKVAFRKVKDLRNANVHTDVISPECVPELVDLMEQESITWNKREYRAGDCTSYGLVIVATNNPEVNRAISEEACNAGIPVNVVDIPELCTVYFPAVVRRDPMLVAVSTAGAAPFYAKELRKELETWVDDGKALRLRWAAEIRIFALENIPDYANREKFFKAFLEYPDAEIHQWSFEDPPVSLWRNWSNLD